MISNVKEMEEILKSRQYPNLEVSLAIIEEEGHASAAPAAIMKGFQALFGE